MPMLDRQFEDFAVGDYVTFKRVFTLAEFARFSEMSGDVNPLHHDVRYAAQSSFGEPIVPMHMVTMPLSAVAGMMLPGHRSLYIGLQVRALEPVSYDEEITYSARVVALHPAQQMLSLRVIAFAGNAVLLEAEMKVKVREDIARNAWLEAAPEIRNEKEGRSVLISGASGHIGAAVARKLAAAGWNLVLACNASTQKMTDLERECRAYGVAVVALSADLSDEKAVRSLADSSGPIVAIVHAASPPIDAAAESLFSVNFSALKVLTELALPEMLRRQYGRVLLIGSSALQYSPRGWENYVASKAAAVSFVEAIQLRYSHYGIGGITLAPGFVHTPFSEIYRDPTRLALMPEEVAERVCEAIEQPIVAHSYVWLEPQSVREGRMGFYQGDSVLRTSEVISPSVMPSTVGRSEPRLNSLEELVRQFFQLSPNTAIEEAGLNLTPGWDSLRHIELMLKIESELGVRFSSAEVEKTARYSDLRELIHAKRS